MKLTFAATALLFTGCHAASWDRVDQTWGLLLGVGSTDDPDTIFLPTIPMVSKSVDGAKTFTNIANSEGLMQVVRRPSREGRDVL